MEGGLLQLVAYGAQDIYLTGNPQITFFKIVYRRHTNFSMESILQTISGNSQLNSKNNVNGSVIVSRNGDLLHKVYVMSDTIGIMDGLDIINEVEIEIGGQLIDRHTKEWNQIWSELTLPESKVLGYKNMIGTMNHGLNQTGLYGVNMVQIPIHFWFCRNPGLSLPLIALQYHEVQLNFTFGSSVGTTANVDVYCDYFYLDTDERRRFAQVSHEYLIEQLQIQKCNDLSDVKLNLNHPVKEIIWTSDNDYGEAQLKLNGHDRFSKQRQEYFQLRQPYDYHTAIPGYNIPLKDATEFLTTPIDTNIRKNIYAGAIDDQDIYNTGGIYRAMWLSIHIDSMNQLVEKVVSIDTTYIRYSSTSLQEDIPFRIGDIINIVITPGTINDDIPYQMVSMHRVNNIIDNVIHFQPSIPNFPQDGLYPRDPDAGGAGLDTTTDLMDNVYVYIIGRLEERKSRCSTLNKKINCYSFSLNPEEHQPSGTCNFSRIDTARLLTTNPLTSEDNIYAINYNILRIMSGMGGLAYSN